jgi:hypothetical protein
MDWCSVYLTPQGLPKYIYLSPPLIFLTTYNNGIRTKNCPVWITPGTAPIRWMGPIRNPRWEQKRTEGYVIVSTLHSTPRHEWVRTHNFRGDKHWLYKVRVREMCQSCQTWPAKFGQILLRTDTRLVFCNRKLMRTDIFFTRTTKPICNFANSVR